MAKEKTRVRRREKRRARRDDIVDQNENAPARPGRRGKRAFDIRAPARRGQRRLRRRVAYAREKGPVWRVEVAARLVGEEHGRIVPAFAVAPPGGRHTHERVGSVRDSGGERESGKAPAERRRKEVPAGELERVVERAQAARVEPECRGTRHRRGRETAARAGRTVARQRAARAHGGRVENGERRPAGAAHAAAAEIDARGVTDAAARRSQKLEKGREKRGAPRPGCRCLGARHGPGF